MEKAPAARTSIVSVAAACAAMALALLLPMTFSDPNGIDPFLLRVDAVIAVLSVASVASPQLRPARAPLIAMATATISYSLWLVVDSGDFPGSGLLNGDWWVLLASLVQTAVTLAGWGVIRLTVRPAARPRLRLGFGWLALIMTIAGCALVVLVYFAIPAQWIGRVALQPAAIARDAPWLLPGFLLQGAAQELAFRGLLMASLERSMSPRWANLTQAAFFGFGHLAVSYGGPEVALVPLALLIGVVTGWATQRSRSLWPAMAVHGLVDVVVWVGIVAGLYGT